MSSACCMFLLTWLRLLSRELGSGSGGVKKLKDRLSKSAILF